VLGAVLSPGDTKAAAIVEECLTSQANTCLLVNGLAAAAIHVGASSEELAPSTLLARVDEGAAARDHLTGLILDLVVTAGSVRAGLG